MKQFRLLNIKSIIGFSVVALLILLYPFIFQSFRSESISVSLNNIEEILSIQVEPQLQKVIMRNRIPLNLTQEDEDKLTEGQVFDPEQNVDLDQTDPRLQDYIRQHHLWPPLPVPYNLTKPFEDPAKKEGQNRIVMKLLQNKRNGIFIEAGANDGEFLSNTLMLERDFGWTGLLVEPDSRAFSTLRGKHRKSWLTNACLSISNRPQLVKFLMYLDTSTWSKVQSVSDHHKKWDATQIKEVNVKCLPLYSILLSLNMTVIDYFSLDVEGAELKILKTIPFESLLIKIISVEFDHIELVKGADAELKRLMFHNHYRLFKKVVSGYARDYIFVHSSVPNPNETKI